MALCASQTSGQIEEVAGPQVLVRHAKSQRVCSTFEIQEEDFYSSGNQGKFHRNQKAYKDKGGGQPLQTGRRRIFLATTATGGEIHARIISPQDAGHSIEVNNWAAQQGLPLEILEPCEWKHSRTVLRGEGGGNASDPLGDIKAKE